MVHRFGHVFWLLSTCVTVFMLIAVLTIGSVRMSAVLLREAQRMKDNSKEMNRISMVEQNQHLSDCLRARAENVVSCARQIRAFCICLMISLLGYFIAEYAYAPPPIIWIMIACISVNICGIHWAVMSCIGTSMRIDEAHFGRVMPSSKSSSRSLRGASQPGQALDSNNLGLPRRQSEVNCGNGCATDIEATGRISSDQLRTQNGAGSSFPLTWSEEVAAAPAALVV
mmetsp:Transcript_22197/g.46835  ORF Transcript_22197/g.46835 Transcript_22197/m.46835 type:complete len:227 (-) Transcript_22197:409-1089(-)